MNNRRKGFTLIELLVVMAIIAIIGAGSIAMVRFNSSRQSLVAAQQTLMSAFEEARMIATSKNVRSRVLIYKGNDPARTLKQIGIIYEAQDQYGENLGWISAGMPVNLPKNTFFIPPSGEYNSYVKLSDEYRESDVINSTFRSSVTGAPSTVSLSEFSRKPQSVGESSGDWYSYEFSAEGLSENPSAAIIVGVGTVGPNGIINMENPFDILGFVVLRTGRTVGFSDYAEIDGNIKGN